MGQPDAQDQCTDAMEKSSDPTLVCNHQIQFRRECSNLPSRRKARRLSITNRELLLAASEGNAKDVEHLLERGADVNFRDRDGNTALHWAVDSGNLEVLNLLLRKGATQSKNRENHTPVDLAKLLERQEILKILGVPSTAENRKDQLPKSTALPPRQKLKTTTSSAYTSRKIEKYENGGPVPKAVQNKNRGNQMSADLDNREMSSDAKQPAENSKEEIAQFTALPPRKRQQKTSAPSPYTNNKIDKINGDKFVPKAGPSKNGEVRSPVDLAKRLESQVILNNTEVASDPKSVTQNIKNQSNHMPVDPAKSPDKQAFLNTSEVPLDRKPPNENSDDEIPQFTMLPPRHKPKTTTPSPCNSAKIDKCEDDDQFVPKSGQNKTQENQAPVNLAKRLERQAILNNSEAASGSKPGTENHMTGDRAKNLDRQAILKILEVPLGSKPPTEKSGDPFKALPPRQKPKTSGKIEEGDDRAKQTSVDLAKRLDSQIILNNSEESSSSKPVTDNKTDRHNHTPADLDKRLNGQEMSNNLEVPPDLKPPAEMREVEASQPTSASPNQKAASSKAYTRRKIEKGDEDRLVSKIYQLKLLMLLLHRSSAQKYSFRLGAGAEGPNKLNDLSLERTANGRKEFRIFQAKHSPVASSKITADHLLSQSECDYCLAKSFLFYQDTRKDKLFKGVTIKELTLCTNSDLDFESLEAANIKVEMASNPDGITDVAGSKKSPQRYRLSEDVAALLKPILKDYNLNRLARRLTTCLMTSSPIKDFERTDIFKDYHLVLGHEVIDVKKKQFKPKFIEDRNLSDDAQTFRQIFMDELAFQSKGQLTLKNINEALGKRTILEGRQIGLSLSKKFGKGVGTMWPQDTSSDEEIQDFLRHFVLAVNQPSETELSETVKTEIGKEFDLITTDNVYSKFLETMLDWTEAKAGKRFLSSSEAEEFFKEAKNNIHVLFNIRHPAEFFTGRDEQLEELHRMLQKLDAFFVVSGIHGIGKSELVRKYAQQYSQDYDNKIAWINAESYQSLAESFRRLACNQLRLNTKNANGEEKEVASVVKDVYKVLSSRNSLFIFDNADKYSSQNSFDKGVDQFLPSSPSNVNNPCVLITSRHLKWPININTLRLGPFSEVEAIRFIKRSLSINDCAQDRDITELANVLQLFPLALQQAVAYIRAHELENINIESEFRVAYYLKIFKEKTKKLPNIELPDDSENVYSKTIFATWHVALDAIGLKKNGKDASEVLNVASYLAAEHIPSELFLGLVSNERDLNAALELLKLYSMISLEQGVFHVHRIVQQVTRIELRKREKDVLRRAMKMLQKKAIDSSTITHAMSIWTYASNYNDIVQEFADIARSIACELIANKRYEEAYLFGVTLTELLQNLQLDNPRASMALIVAKNNIAATLLEKGKYDLALEAFQDLLKIEEKYTLPNSEHSMLGTLNSLALVLSSQGNGNAALSNLKSVFNTSEFSRATEHPDTLSAKHGVAIIALIQGRFDEALQHLQEIFTTQRSTLPDNHPDIVTTKGSIAGVLCQQQKYEESLQMFQEVLGLLEKTFKPHHPKVLNTKNSIASILVAQHKYGDALEIYRQVLDARELELDESHPDVLSSRRNVADVLRHLGECDKAMQLYQKVFNKQKSILTLDHEDTVTTQDAIAHVLVDQGKREEALPIFLDVLSKRKSLLPHDHPAIVKTINNIAVIHAIQGEHDKALQCYEEVHSIQQSTVGPNHNDTLGTKNNIGMIHFGKRDFNRALQIFQDVYRERKKILPENHPDTLTVFNNIGLIMSCVNKQDEALRIFEEILDLQKDSLEKDDSRVIETKRSIAAVLLKQGRRFGALKALQDIFDGFSRNYGPNHPDTVKIASNIKAITNETRAILTAVEDNNIEEIEKLLTKGADVDTKDEDDNTLLHLAARSGRLDTVNLLLENAADPTQVTRHGETALHLATQGNHIEVVEILLQHMNITSVNAQTNDGSTSLHIASKNGHLTTVRTLLTRGAAYDIRNNQGKTPLTIGKDRGSTDLLGLVDSFFVGAERGDMEIITRLKETKQNPKAFHAVTSARNYLGKTLLLVALSSDHKDFARDLGELLRKQN